MSSFIDKLKDIGGSTFDSVTGEPLDGKWLEIKNWYNELSVQDSTFLGYLNDAISNADKALVSENNAKASELASADSQANAEASSVSSASSAILAGNYANALEDELVGTEYSAYHFMKKAEKEKWETEAWKKTAESYATAPVNTFVTEYASNADGSFTATVTDKYSALHYESIMKNINIENMIAGNFPTVDPAIAGVLWSDNNVLTISQG